MIPSSAPAGVVVCKADDVQVKSAIQVDVADVLVAIVRDSYGELHAIGDTCTHQDVSLSEGDVEDCTIECWAHGSSFDLKTGEALTLPAFEPVPVFALTVYENDVYVDVTNILNGVSV